MAKTQETNDTQATSTISPTSLLHTPQFSAPDITSLATLDTTSSLIPTPELPLENIDTSDKNQNIPPVDIVSSLPPTPEFTPRSIGIDNEDLPPQVYTDSSLPPTPELPPRSMNTTGKGSLTEQQWLDTIISAIKANVTARIHLSTKQNETEVWEQVSEEVLNTYSPYPTTRSLNPGITSSLPQSVPTQDQVTISGNINTTLEGSTDTILSTS